MDQQQFLRSYYDAISSHDINKFLSFVNDDARFTVVSTEESYRGKNELRAMAEKWLKAFPDGKFQIRKIFGSGDDWSVELSFTGTHQGPLTGPLGDIPATGKKVNVPANEVVTIKNGKIQSLNCYMAGTILLNQLGAIPMQKAA